MFVCADCKVIEMTWIIVAKGFDETFLFDVAKTHDLKIKIQVGLRLLVAKEIDAGPIYYMYKKIIRAKVTSKYKSSRK